jgi:hypothetical protein
MTPVELARDLNMSPKVLRSWLRRTFPRSAVEHFQRWELTPEMVLAAKAHFGSR